MKKYWWWVSLIVLLGAALAIRLFHLTQSPPSPYWEEAALGYDAYSILVTGKDHHGNPWPVIAFESFGDWKPSGYFYALLPSIRTFGLTVFAVRLPSVIAGVGIVFGMGVLIWQLTAQHFKNHSRRWLTLLAAFLAALSPWLIQFSRGGWEVNLATALILWGVICGQQAIATPQREKRRFAWLLGCIIFLFAAMYTYHSARILAPALGLVIGWQFLQRDLHAKRKHLWLVGYIFPLFLTAALLRPFTSALGTPALNQRLAETSILSDLSIIEQSNQLRALHHNSPLSRLMYHRYVLFGERILSQFLTHFRLDFLFLSGDVNPRHSTQYFGLFYPFEIVFLLVGAWWVLQHFSREQKQVLAAWLIFGIVPAALTMTVPHALRILPSAPVFLVALTVGVWQVLNLPFVRRWQKLLIAGVIGAYLIAFVAFYQHLLVVYPKQFSGEWQYGYQQLIQTVQTLQTAHPDLPVYITREQGRPAMYYWFYTQTNPTVVQAANATAKQDQGEFLEFQNLHFVNSLSEVTVLPAIIAGSPQQVTDVLGSTKNLTEDQIISNLGGIQVWQVGIAH